MQEKVYNKRFSLNDYKIKISNNNNIAVFEDICDVINFFKNNYVNGNTTERNIRTCISNAIKHNTKYFGFSLELFPKESQI